MKREINIAKEIQKKVKELKGIQDMLWQELRIHISKLNYNWDDEIVVKITQKLKRISIELNTLISIGDK